jgi:ATP-binding cassette subfamily B protein
MRERLRAGRIVMRYVFQADKARTVSSFVVGAGSQLVDFSGAILLKLLTDAAVEGDEGGVVLVAVLLALCLAGSIFGNWANLAIGMALRERATLFFDARMAELSAGIHTVEHHERPDYLDNLEVLRQNHQRLAAVQDALVGSLLTLLRLGATVLLLATLHPLLLLLPLFGLPSLWATARAERLRNDVREQVAGKNRLSTKLFELATGPAAGKEIRLYGAGPELLSRYDAATHEAERMQDDIDRRVTVTTAVGWMVFGAGFTAALLLVGRMAVRGEASPGDVVLALTLASQVNYGVSGLAGVTSWLFENLNIGTRLVWLEDLAAQAAAAADPAQPAPVPDHLAGGIRFEGVSFRYPGAGEDALTDVDLFLPAGSTVAIVGDNGAGKTTVVKLLCRFYDPSAGRITVDGVDLTCFDVAEWRRRLSGCFQDFACLELATRQAVGVGHLPVMDDEGAVMAALRRAHATDVVDGLPGGLSTLLGRTFEGGVELSTGQWQKLALGRAMMRDAPLLLVLDEPTASLDAVTEHALFERYAGAASEAAARSGAVTVLVSHRFSTVRMADLIVVLHDGRVGEVGSHAELVAAGGAYAELYELQARAYR